MRQFILLRQEDGAWSLFAPTMIGRGLFLLASGPADWNPLEARWTRPASGDFEMAESRFLALHAWQAGPTEQSPSTN
jgi:hypothetical protein